LLTAAGNNPVDLLATCEAAAPHLIATWSGFAGRFAQVVHQYATRLEAGGRRKAWGAAALARSDGDSESSAERAAVRFVRG
jgi:hypothetical protein